MTTATMTETPAPVVTPVPVEPDLASIFYNTTAPAAAIAPVVEPPPSPTSETGLPTTPEPASVASTEPATSNESPVGTETKEKKADDKGHAAAARRLGSEVADLKRDFAVLAEENRILKAKADGTYQEPAQPTTEEVTARAEFKGRETASRAVAEGQFGAETIKTQIYDDASPYKVLVQEKPWLHVRVARHPQPTLEAMRVLHEQTFLKTYGDDPLQWVSKIEAELKPKLFDEFKKQAAVQPTGTRAPSVTEARGSGGRPKEMSLEQMFYGKTAPPSA
jgi:hypothetical protein